jgi:hypothetical protein
MPKKIKLPVIHVSLYSMENLSEKLIATRECIWFKKPEGGTRDVDGNPLELAQYDHIGHCRDCKYFSEPQYGGGGYCHAGHQDIEGDPDLVLVVPDDGSGFCWKFEQRSQT